MSIIANRHIVMGLALAAPFLAASVVHAAGYTQTVESFNPIGYYQFSSSAGGQSDSSVNGFTGTLEGTPTATLSAPGAGPAIADDPNNTALVLTNSSGQQQFLDTNLPGNNVSNEISSAGTILAWINLAQLPSDAGRTFTIAGESTVGDDFDLQIETDDKIKFYTDGGSSTVDPTALTAGDLNQWIFVAASFTANTSRSVYINGVNVATSVPGGHNPSSNNFAIGESDVFQGRYFNGMIDEVAVFNTALSDSDIAEIYASAGNPAPEPATAALMLLPMLGLLRRPKRARA